MRTILIAILLTLSSQCSVAAGELVLVGLEKISKKVAQHLLNHDNVVTEFDLKYIANSEEGNK